MFRKSISCIALISFILSLVVPTPQVQAQNFLGLPEPGTMVSLSSAYEPALIKGLTVHKENPFLFDFILDRGKSQLHGQDLKDEGDRLIKYFFAALTIPDKDLWVNLSPYEKDRMIPQALGQTGMGRDLLAQDYMLKQITASLIYPENGLGRKFWDKIYTQAQKQFGTTQIPVNTFNKVWIVADKASVYEHNQTAFIVSGHLKVMLEEDYLATQKHDAITQRQPGDMASAVSSSRLPSKSGLQMKTTQGTNLTRSIIKEIIIPALENEVNEGENFATLRQIFYSQILATWFKRNLKQALLSQVYANKSDVNGVNLNDPSIKDKIYKRYLEAYKKGAFNFIKDEKDQVTNQIVPRKYFSGGYALHLSIDPASQSAMRVAAEQEDGLTQMTTLLDVQGSHVHTAAMLSRNLYDKLLAWDLTVSDRTLSNKARRPSAQHFVYQILIKNNRVKPVVEGMLRNFLKNISADEAEEIMLGRSPKYFDYKDKETLMADLQVREFAIGEGLDDWFTDLERRKADERADYKIYSDRETPVPAWRKMMFSQQYVMKALQLAIILGQINVEERLDGAMGVTQQISHQQASHLAYKIFGEETAINGRALTLAEKIAAANAFIDEGILVQDGKRLNSADLKAISGQLSSIHGNYDRKGGELHVYTMVLPEIIFTKEVEENDETHWLHEDGYDLVKWTGNIENAQAAGFFVKKENETHFRQAFVYRQTNGQLFVSRLRSFTGVPAWLQDPDKRIRINNGIVHLPVSRGIFDDLNLFFDEHHLKTVIFQADQSNVLYGMVQADPGAWFIPSQKVVTRFERSKDGKRILFYASDGTAGMYYSLNSSRESIAPWTNKIAEAQYDLNNNAAMTTLDKIQDFLRNTPLDQRVVLLTNTDQFSLSNPLAIGFLNSGRTTGIIALKGIGSGQAAFPLAHRGVFNEFYFDGHPKAVGLPYRFVTQDETLHQLLPWQDWANLLETGIYDPGAKKATQGVKDVISAWKDKLGLPISDIELLENQKFATLGRQNAKVQFADEAVGIDEGEALNTVYANFHILDLDVIDAIGQERTIRTYQNSPIITDKVTIVGIGPRTKEVWGRIIQGAKVILIGDATGLEDVLKGSQELITVDPTDHALMNELSKPESWRIDAAMGDVIRDKAIRDQHAVYFGSINKATSLKPRMFLDIVHFYDKNYDYISAEFSYELSVTIEKIARLMQKQQIMGLENKPEEKGRFTKRLKEAVKRVEGNPVIVNELIDAWTTLEIKPKDQTAALSEIRDSIVNRWQNDKSFDFKRFPEYVADGFVEVVDNYYKGLRGKKPEIVMSRLKPTKINISIKENEDQVEDDNLYMERFWTNLFVSINNQLDASMGVQESQADITNGGIDLKSLDAGLSVTKDAQGGVVILADPAIIERVKREGIQRAQPVIIQMTDLASVLPLLGLS